MPGRLERARELVVRRRELVVRRWLPVAPRAGLATILGLGLVLGLLGGGLDLAPRIGMAAPEPGVPPRRPPVLNPAVPFNASEEEALWSYLYRIAPIWESDRPTVIRLLEQFLARYPDNPVALEKLYAVHVEDGKARARSGDQAGARRRYLEAVEIDPNRNEAWELLEELDSAPQPDSVVGGLRPVLDRG